MSLIAIAINVLLAALLLVALGFGWRLDRRLRAVRDGQVAFTKAVAELDSASGRAQAGLAALRAATDEAIDLLGGRIVRAREAGDRLDEATDLLGGRIVRAKEAGDRLDEALARAEAAPQTAPAPPAGEMFAANPEPRGLEALLARLEQSRISPSAARPGTRPSPVRRPLIAAADLDDDLFVDGGRA